MTAYSTENDGALATGEIGDQGAACVVHIQDLDFKYGRNSVLEAVNLDIHQNDFIGLVGPNGGGKTTLIKLILGMLHPLSGLVEVLGEMPRRARNQVGYVPQHVEFDTSFPVTVEEMVLMGRLGHVGLGRRYRSEDREIARKAMGQLELNGLAKRPIHALSGGERQRAMLARALASEPRILILDEPTASVDSRVEKDFYELLKELNARVPVILVSHDLGFISAYVSRVACLNRRLVVNDVSDVHAQDLEAMYDSPMRLWSHDCEL